VVTAVITNEWQPIGYDPRVALMLSGYTSQLFTVSSAQDYAVVPYVLWFDQFGTFISSLYVRTNLSSNTPQSITFSSFSLPYNWGNAIAPLASATDIKSANVGVWVQQASTWGMSAYYGGSVSPSSASVQAIATQNYSGAAAFCGVTLCNFTTGGGANVGLVLRWASNTSYIRVDEAQIVEVNGTAYSTLAVHSTPAQPGDRLTASASGNVITAFINGTQVSTATTAFNNGATVFGIVDDLPTQEAPIFGTVMPASIYQSLRQRQRPLRNRRVTVHGQTNKAYSGQPVLGPEIGIAL
jgi:hypothetical protein